MKIIFSQEERDRLIGSLLDERQKRFLDEQMRRGKQTAFARELARSKGVVITETMSEEELERFIDDWLLVDFIDAGPGYAAKGYKCACGRTLRYVYKVKHKETGEQISFGKEHFEEHTHIPAAVVKSILSGMDAIDYELDEILHKLHDKWSFAEAFRQLPAEFPIPEDMAQQLQLGLPLLDRQSKKLHMQLRRYEDERLRPPAKPSLAESRVKPLDAPPKPESSSQAEAADSGPEQFAFDFFIDEPSPNDTSPSASTAARANPKQAGRPIAKWDGKRDSSNLLLYIKEGIQSARALTELLISRSGYPDDRYVTGKPRLYPLVCRELDRLAATGELILTSADPSHEDRVYRLP